MHKSAWRLKYHLMPPKGWMNDPNGLCYFKGEYHVFYQYSPDNVNGGLKYWGHYKSKDLLKWEDLGIFLSPDKDFKISGAYSGSAIEKDGELYLLYTGNVKKQGAYDYINEGREHNTVLAKTSDGINVLEDRVVLYNKDYPANLSLHVRDPKVFEFEGKYYMVLGARTKEGRGQVEVFESENLYDWQHINTIKPDYDFGYMWECPDLFLLDGTWFLILSPQGVAHEKYSFQNEYSCGYFPLYGDFRSEYTLGEYRELDTGFDYYAPQTFEVKGRRLGIAWFGMPDASYTAPTTELGWQHAMSVMKEYKNIDNKLYIKPVEEYAALFGDLKEYSLNGEYIHSAQKEAYDIYLSEIEEFSSITFCDTVKLELEDDVLILSHIANEYGRDKRYTKIEKLENMRILMDSSSLEIFINDGIQSISTRFYPQNYERINFMAKAKLGIKEFKG